MWIWSITDMTQDPIQCTHRHVGVDLEACHAAVRRVGVHVRGVDGAPGGGEGGAGPQGVPVRVGAALLDGARVDVDVEEDGGVVGGRALAAGAKDAGEGLDEGGLHCLFDGWLDGRSVVEWFMRRLVGWVVERERVASRTPRNHVHAPVSKPWSSAVRPARGSCGVSPPLEAVMTRSVDNGALGGRRLPLRKGALSNRSWMIQSPPASAFL